MSDRIGEIRTLKTEQEYKYCFREGLKLRIMIGKFYNDE